MGVYCDYLSTLEIAANHPLTITNYATLLYHGAYSGKLSPRRLLIVDEAHRSEDILMGFISVEISRRSLNAYIPTGGVVSWELPKLKMAAEVLRWLKDEIEPRLPSAEGAALRGTNFGNAAYGRHAARRFTFLRNLGSKIEELEEALAGEEEWVVDPSRLPDFLVIKPVTVSRYGPKIFRFGQKVVLFSGTILDPYVMAESLGIPEDRCSFIDVPSTFPLENRPFIHRFVGAMTRRDMERTKPLLLEEVKSIAEFHGDEKGVVHTHTFDLAQDVMGILGDRAMTHSSGNREEVLGAFIADQNPRILVSPSMTDGLDLPGDLGRWQILAKTPYPYLGDPQVRRRAEIDPDWYSWRTCVTVAQVPGRIVRGPDDWGVTYFLDSSTERVVNENASILPASFMDAWNAALIA